MKRYCENPLCQNRPVEEVPVSVNELADQTRALCATCDEAYSWGVQHSRMAVHGGKVWVLAIADRGIVAHVHACKSHAEAEKHLAEYLREYEDYDGQDNIGEVQTWLDEHNERLSVEIVQQSI